MLWGFFKKIVIADNCAVFVNQIFSDYENLKDKDFLIFWKKNSISLTTASVFYSPGTLYNLIERNLYNK